MYFIFCYHIVLWLWILHLYLWSRTNFMKTIKKIELRFWFLLFSIKLQFSTILSKFCSSSIELSMHLFLLFKKLIKLIRQFEYCWLVCIICQHQPREKDTHVCTPFIFLECFQLVSPSLPWCFMSFVGWRAGNKSSLCNPPDYKNKLTKPIPQYPEYWDNRCAQCLDYIWFLTH